MTPMPAPDLDFVLRRGVFEIISERELRERVAEGAPLRLKMGFDPSRPDLHIGHAVALRKLRQLQELGHRVVLIVGDWTARIGDPSGQSETRTMLSEEQVNANAETYLRQFFMVVDRDRTELVRQSEWFGSFSLADVISLTSRFTVAQMLAREDFARRYAEHRPIAITEFLYPLLQGYDSVAIRSDVEFGGSDQKFNCLVGRDLQGMVGQRQQQVFLVPLLAGTDGRKMSKSYGNTVDFEAPPTDMYGKLMSIADDVMMDYFELLTDVPDGELAEFRRDLEAGRAHPMELKHRLAGEIVAQFHGVQGAGAAEAHFRRVVQGREAPEEVPTRTLREVREALTHPPGLGFSQAGNPKLSKRQLTELLAAWKLTKSIAEARRLIDQGGVEVDGEKAHDRGLELKAGTLIKVGRRQFVRLVGEWGP